MSKTKGIGAKAQEDNSTMPDAHRRRVKAFCTFVQQGQYRLLSCHVRDKSCRSNGISSGVLTVVPGLLMMDAL
jgi:hypothetical protein